MSEAQPPIAIEDMSDEERAAYVLEMTREELAQARLDLARANRVLLTQSAQIRKLVAAGKVTATDAATG